ncbi:MAG: N-acyl homoserine lactonase family protein [Solirubrobacterales bacterium]
MRVRAETRRLTAPFAAGSEGATVAVEPLRVGRTRWSPKMMESPRGRFAMARAVAEPPSSWPLVPCPAYLVHHPSAGPFLVDTGLHPSVAAKPAANMGRLAAGFGKPLLDPGEDLPAQLRARGIDPKGIRLVVMTHLHLDHASGMAEFPGATFVVANPEWVAATTERRPLLHGYRPAHYDYAFDYRTLDYNGELIDSYSTFGRTFDLFGDASVRLAFTPGHSAGHQAVICRLGERDLVIAGDAVYTYRQLEGGPEPLRPFDLHTWRRSLRELQLFHRQYPQAVILPGHDAEHFAGLEQRYE